MTTMTSDSSKTRMLPRPQWRMVNMLDRDACVLRPVNFYEPDLAALLDAQLVELTFGGEPFKVRRRGDGFDLAGREWPRDVRIRLTGRGRRWLRENPYQRAVIAMRGLRARPGRAVLLVTAASAAGIGRADHEVYVELVEHGLVRAFWSTGRELEQPADLVAFDPTVTKVSLSRAGMYVVADDVDRERE